MFLHPFAEHSLQTSRYALDSADSSFSRLTWSVEATISGTGISGSKSKNPQSTERFGMSLKSAPQSACNYSEMKSCGTGESPTSTSGFWPCVRQKIAPTVDGGPQSATCSRKSNDVRWHERIHQGVTSSPGVRPRWDLRVGRGGRKSWTHEQARLRALVYD